MQASTSSNKLKTIIVTGVNRGLGKELAKLLLKNMQSCSLIFTTRKPKAQNKQLQSQLTQQYPPSDNSSTRQLSFKSLDLSSSQSIQQFVKQVKQQKVNVDVLINNAAIGFDTAAQIPKVDYATSLLQTNVENTIKLTNLLIPFLSENARIINVSSKLGGLKFQSEEIQKRFQSADISEEIIFNGVRQYLECCEKKKMNGWFNSSYGTSKMLLNAWSRFILKKKLKQGQVSIVMSPGHCKTDMGGENGAHSAESGAQTIYDCIQMQKPSFDIFYHRGNQYEFMNCGPQVNSVNIEKPKQN